MSTLRIGSKLELMVTLEVTNSGKLMKIDTMIDLRDKDRKAICTIAEQIFAPDT